MQGLAQSVVARRSRFARVASAVLFLAAGSCRVFAADVVIYDEALRNGFVGVYSYGGGSAFASEAQAHSPTHSIAFSGDNYNAVSLTHPTASFSASDYPILQFWIRGDAPGGQQLQLFIYPDRDNDATSVNVPLDSFIAGGSISATEWREVTVPLMQPPLSFNGTFERIDLQSEAGGAVQPTVYIDDVILGQDEIFSAGFDGDNLPPPACGMTDEHDVTAAGMLSDRFDWCDAAGNPRVAVLAHNDGAVAGPGGTRGGELRQLSYQIGAATRTVNASSSFTAGFGYVVSHPIDESHCTGAKLDALYSDPYDTSLIGHLRGGSFQRVFEGRHHAIFRFTTTYPRYCSTVNAAPLGYLVPVTIEWVFATGRDHPLWSVTWDLSAVPANKLEDDSRAPYGELLFDGSATEGGHSTIAGVAWGDRYKFSSTTNPVTLNSAWTWNQPNTIPFVKLWTTDVDATMGTVMTQTIEQKDVAGYFDVVKFWNHTSAENLTNCNGDLGYKMPCVDFWPYQSINFSFGGNNVSTNSTRLAWGTEYGFLGQGGALPQDGYHIHGSTYWGGPLPDATASGWPKQSYSLYVVLGTHSNDPVDAQVGQVETLQTVNLTINAGTGSVATNGPAGVNRDADIVNYDVPGYDPVYGALTFNANAGNALDANIAVGAGTLSHPLIVIRNYSSGAYPTTVKLDGNPLVVDVDYFPSLRPGASELWITLNKDLAGAANQLQIIP